MTDGKQRERLIELLTPFMSAEFCENESGSCEITSCRECRAHDLADHLIENGVIVLPCKIGDEVYRITKRDGKWMIIPREVSGVAYHGGWWDILTTTTDMLGSTVFLTCEEAEAKLKEIGKNT